MEEIFMRRFCLICTAGIAMSAFIGLAQKLPSDGPYRVLKTVKLGGAGTFDTACADTVERKLYIPRKNPGRITVFNLDTLEPAGEIPDAILFDEFNERVYIFSHTAPHATVINAVDGAVLGTIDLGGMPEQAVTDGSGHVYVDIRDKGNVTVIDSETL